MNEGPVEWSFGFLRVNLDLQFEAFSQHQCRGLLNFSPSCFCFWERSLSLFWVSCWLFSLKFMTQPKFQWNASRMIKKNCLTCGEKNFSTCLKFSMQKVVKAKASRMIYRALRENCNRKWSRNIKYLAIVQEIFFVIFLLLGEFDDLATNSQQ